ncbi:hypothetical protein K1719_002730 [Acacia pycnantha]|nr:hypothetical protein K1719_002730 [Acacia pycnantha]
METLKEIVDENECEVFEGLILSSNFCREKYFGAENVDVMPFIDNFPGVEVAGSFYKGEIGRGFSSFDKKKPVRSFSSSCLFCNLLDHVLFSSFRSCS